MILIEVASTWFSWFTLGSESGGDEGSSLEVEENANMFVKVATAGQQQPKNVTNMIQHDSIF